MKEQVFITPEIHHGEDMTAKLLRLTCELEVSNNKLLESEKARIRILENISHDLRSPLTAVRSALDLLTEGSLTETESAKLLDIIDRRVKTLERLVEELYLSQKLNQPEFTPSFEQIIMEAFLEEYYIQLDVSGRMSDRKLVLNILTNAPVLINLDTHLFLRVLDNILSNAYRHTAKGDKIEIEIKDTEKDSVLISIFNSGEQIPSEHLAHVFERTFTTSDARTPEKSGSGLGLHIAKTIVVKHNGKLSCENVVTGGVTFSIVLPKLKN